MAVRPAGGGVQDRALAWSPGRWETCPGFPGTAVPRDPGTGPAWALLGLHAACPLPVRPGPHAARRPAPAEPSRAELLPPRSRGPGGEGGNVARRGFRHILTSFSPFLFVSFLVDERLFCPVSSHGAEGPEEGKPEVGARKGWIQGAGRGAPSRRHPPMRGTAHAWPGTGPRRQRRLWPGAAARPGTSGRGGSGDKARGWLSSPGYPWQPPVSLCHQWRG